MNLKVEWTKLIQEYSGGLPFEQEGKNIPKVLKFHSHEQYCSPPFHVNVGVAQE